MKDIPKLTDLEITVMGVMWEQGKDMTIQEIADCLAEKKVSSSSVSQAVKRMIKKNAVTVSERRPVANVYARVLRPNFDRSEFVKAEVERLGGKMSFRKQLGMAGVVAELLRGDIGEISRKEMKELREMIDGKKIK